MAKKLETLLQRRAKVLELHPDEIAQALGISELLAKRYLSQSHLIRASTAAKLGYILGLSPEEILAENIDKNRSKLYKQIDWKKLYTQMQLIYHRKKINREHEIALAVRAKLMEKKNENP